MRRVFLFISFLFCVFFASAQALDSIRVSLLTCSPGSEVYELYGHTALRCQNFTKRTDVVYNYGVFSFNQPHFLWRFVRGECDYMVMGVEGRYFPLEYARRGSSVTEQVLNLTRVEAARLEAALQENCLPENREYRYNFLYNNCTLKVRDMVEQAIMGRVSYPQFVEKKTYRQILHEYAHPGTWAAEGNDFLLGEHVDTILTDRAAMFAPEYMMRYAAEAQIYGDDGSLRPLVKEEKIILHQRVDAIDADSSPQWEQMLSRPLVVGWLVVAFFLCLLFLERKLNRVMWLVDIPLLMVQGVLGVLLLFMRYFSEHPAVDANWLIWAFSPLALLVLPKVILAAFRRKRCWWHAFQMVYLTFFIIFSHWIPQDFGQIVVPLALALLTRPLSYHLYYTKNRL